MLKLKTWAFLERYRIAKLKYLSRHIKGTKGPYIEQKKDIPYVSEIADTVTITDINGNTHSISLGRTNDYF